MNNLLSYCGLVDARIRACDKDLPLPSNLTGNFNGQNCKDIDRTLKIWLIVCNTGYTSAFRRILIAQKKLEIESVCTVMSSFKLAILIFSLSALRIDSKSIGHSIYISTVSSFSAMLICFKLVYGPFRQSNMH